MREDLYTQLTTAGAASLAAARVHVVAEVLAYQGGARTVSVRPVQQIVRPSGAVVRLGDVHGVKLGTYELGGFVVAGPASRGDVVLLEVPDQSIDRWLEDGAVVEADASRAGRQLAHAIAIPVGAPTSDAFNPGDNLVVGRQSNGVQLVITPDGEVSLGSSVIDVVATLRSVCTKLAASTVGGVPLSNAAEFSALAILLQTIER